MHVVETKYAVMKWPASEIKKVFAYIEQLRRDGIDFKHYFIE